MKQIKTLHQDASNTLWDIGLSKTLIKSKKESIKHYKPMMVDTDRLEDQIKALEISVGILKMKYDRQLKELLTLNDEL